MATLALMKRKKKRKPAAKVVKVPRPLTPAEVEIQDAMKADGAPSCEELSRRIGVNAVNLRQFKAMGRPLNTPNREKLADALGLQIVVVPKATRR